MTTQDHTAALRTLRGHIGKASFATGADRHTALECLAELEKVLAQPQQPAGWRPIETAPKDGTEILLSNGDDVSQGHWLYEAPYIRERRDADGRYIDQDESDGFEGWIDWLGGMNPEPTHWMPLPPAPGAHPSQQEDDVLDAAQRERVRDAIAAALGRDAYDCTRVWEAWHVGTMGQDDFSPIVDQDKRLDEITDAVIAAMTAAQGDAVQGGGKNG